MSEVTVPEEMLAWPLFGAGMENLGKDDQPCAVPVPSCGPEELLVRIDAIGLCFSDVKLIRAGEAHPRVISKDLKSDPVIPGHEAVMTVVRVGDRLTGKFEPGQRFIIQADIYVNGQGFAYGYAIDGGMAQYSLIDQRVLNGDEGCYLLPISEEMPSAVAALLEPWTCVQASYMIENRTAPLPGGRVLIVAGDGQEYRAGAALIAANPAGVIACGISGTAAAALEEELGVAVETVAALPESGSFDDIFLCNVDAETAAAAARLSARNGVTSFIGEYDGELPFDVGRIHYEGFFYQGAPCRELSAAYGRNVRSTLKRGGVCWLPGGAGAMGQMHTQLAVENPDGPARILVSDMDSARIENVRNLLAETIDARGIEFKAVNPAEMSREDFDALLKEFAPNGFDDIVMLVPAVPVLAHAARFLAEDGLMNIFAGIPAGVEAALSLEGIVKRGQRYIGSSGSRTEHLRHTLVLAETGELNPVTALAAVGGMNVLKDGLEAVIAARFPGKTVIFPNAPDLPLTPVGKLAGLGAGIADTLDCGGNYTLATELELRRMFE